MPYLINSRKVLAMATQNILLYSEWQNNKFNIKVLKICQEIKLQAVSLNF